MYQCCLLFRKEHLRVGSFELPEWRNWVMNYQCFFFGAYLFAFFKRKPKGWGICNPDPLLNTQIQTYSLTVQQKSKSLMTMAGLWCDPSPLGYDGNTWPFREPTKRLHLFRGEEQPNHQVMVEFRVLGNASRPQAGPVTFSACASPIRASSPISGLDFNDPHIPASGGA